MAKRHLPLLLASLFGIAGAAGSLAEEASNQQDIATLSEQVVVSAAGEPIDAARTGAGVTVITRESIERSRATTVASLLRSVPGVDVIEQGSPGELASVLVRGGDYRQVLVLVDGVRVTDPYFGGMDWAHLPATAVERIEVVRGPYSALWGTDAVAGVIQIFTRRGGAERLSGSIEAGSRGERRIEAGGAGESGPLRWSIDGSWRNGDGFRPNDGYENRFGAARLDFSIGEARVGVETRLTRGELGIPYEYYPVDGFPPEGQTPTPDRRTEVDEDLWVVPAEIPLGGGFSLDARVSRVEKSFRFRDPDDPWMSASDTASRGDSATGALRWQGRGHAATLLFDWRRDTVDASTTDPDGLTGAALDGERTSIRGWALEDAWDIGRGFSLVAGVRRDEHSGFGATTHPRGSLAWTSPDGRLALSIAAGSAFRAPSTGELHYPWSGNPSLDPERTRSAEAGVEWRDPEGFHGSLRGFTDRTEDKIDFDPATWTFGNIGRTRSRGIEMTAGAPLGAGLQLLADATWLDAEKLVEEGTTGEERWDPLPRRASWRGSARLGWAAGGASAELRAMVVGRRPDVDPVTYQPIENPGYVRVDLAASFPLREWLVPFARIRNLLDRRYDEAAGYQAAGRLWVVGVELRGAPGR